MQIFNKTYGNYLGFVQLGAYMVHKMGMTHDTVSHLGIAGITADA